MAGTIALFPDVNMYYDGYGASDPENFDVLSNLLGGGTNVLYSYRTGDFDYSRSNIVNYYNSLSGVTAVSTVAELNDAGFAGVDLAFIDVGFSQSSSYSASEVSALNNFVASGGSLGIIAEPLEESLSSVNNLLSDLGLAMQLTLPRLATGVQTADTILATPLTAGVTSFTFGAFDPITGGTPAMIDSNHTLLAFETGPAPASVPLPAALPLFASALGGMGLIGWRRRRKGSVAAEA
jgi:hypothetical protein